MTGHVAPLGGEGCVVSCHDGRQIQTMNMIIIASFSPKTLMDCFLLYADPVRAVSVLGAVLAAILLFWGALYFFMRYVLPWLRGQ